MLFFTQVAIIKEIILATGTGNISNRQICTKRTELVAGVSFHDFLVVSLLSVVSLLVSTRKGKVVKLSDRFKMDVNSLSVSCCFDSHRWF